MPSEIIGLEEKTNKQGFQENTPKNIVNQEKTSSWKTFRWLLLIFFVLALVIGAYSWVNYNRNRISTDDAQVDGHIVPMASKNRRHRCGGTGSR